MKVKDRASFQLYVAGLDEAQTLCIQALLKEEKRDIELMLNDTQLRLDYLGVFTPANITKLARNCERKDEEKTEM